jgi:hypothetical protein
VERLSSLDTAFLCLDSADRPDAHGSAAAVQLARCGGPASITALLAARADRIDRLRLRPCTLLWPPGSAAWRPDPDFAPARHVFAHSARRAGDVGRLVARVAEVMAQPLPAARPPWQLHAFPTVHPANGFAVLVKLQHALADGEGVLAVCGGLLDSIVTTVPLPDVPMHIGGAALHEIYPLVPIAPNHGLSLAVATYCGGMHLGLLTDPGAWDSERLAAALTAAPAELRDADPATAENPATADDPATGTEDSP